MSEDQRRSGLLFGAGAYAMWGLFPAFFPLLKPASAFEILAHRIVWCFVLMVVVGAASVMREMGARAVLVKGGHLKSNAECRMRDSSFPATGCQ